MLLSVNLLNGNRTKFPFHSLDISFPPLPGPAFPAIWGCRQILQMVPAVGFGEAAAFTAALRPEVGRLEASDDLPSLLGASISGKPI